MTKTVAELLAEHRAEVAVWIEHEAAGLLRFESADDLVQGVCARALGSASSFVYKSQGEALSWLRTLTLRHVADRHAHWSALRRGAGRVFRYTLTGGPEAGPGVPIPADQATGPATFAERREMLVLATRTLATLPDRDRELLGWHAEGLTLKEQADRLGISYDAAQRAAHRALARFRRAFRVLGDGRA